MSAFAVAIGGLADIARHSEIDANDPERQFGTVNYRIAKGLFDHLVCEHK
jgi:hypothetical protein